MTRTVLYFRHKSSENSVFFWDVPNVLEFFGWTTKNIIWQQFQSNDFTFSSFGYVCSKYTNDINIYNELSHDQIYEQLLEAETYDEWLWNIPKNIFEYSIRNSQSR